MILVDSSVWIDFFSAKPASAGRALKKLIEETAPVALTGIVITEILQGLIRDAAAIEKYLRMWKMLEPRGFFTYRDAASIFRLARSKGVTLTTVDALIAAIALEHRAAVFTFDRDFAHLAGITKLALYTP